MYHPTGTCAREVMGSLPLQTALPPKPLGGENISDDPADVKMMRVQNTIVGNWRRRREGGYKLVIQCRLRTIYQGGRGVDSRLLASTLVKFSLVSG